MKQEETKYTFVYNEIKQRILSGQIPYGKCLPSSRMLCEQFHVSRYTINRVFDTLREENFIEIQPRLAPTVTFKRDISGVSDTLTEILKQKDNIIQVYQTFGLIIPPLLVFASQNCELEFLPHYKQAVRESRLGRAAGGWRVLSSFGADIL